jgi:hypothetical protein
MARSSKETDSPARNIDIWLVLVIILLVLTIGGGLWITGQSVLSRIDSLAIQTRSQISTLEVEVFELRKQVQNLHMALRHRSDALEEPAAPEEPAAAPTPEPEAP